MVSFIQNSGQFNGLANYRAIVNSASPTIGHVLIDTLLFVGISLVFQYGIGLALAIFFSRRFPANAFLRSLIRIAAASAGGERNHPDLHVRHPERIRSIAC